MRPRVLLLEPLFPSERIWGRFKAGGGFVPPIGLITVYSYLRRSGFDAEFCDARSLGLTAEALRAKLRAGRYDVVGLPVFTNTCADSMRTARLVKEVLPGARVALGGVHATLLPERTLNECAAADWVVAGEGELTMAELLRRLEADPGADPAGVPGLWRRGPGGAPVAPPERPLIDDVDALPHPCYDAIPMDVYVPHPTQYRRLPNFPLFTQRGCPYQCTFCQASVTMGKRVRVKSPQKTLDEVELLIAGWGARGVYFQDSAFTINKRWAHALCDEIRRRGLRFDWACNARVDNVDRRLLEAMRAAGCWMIAYGIESGNQESLDLLKKGITLAQQRAAVAETRRAGIQVLANYLIGVPGEDEAMVLRTCAHAAELGAEMSLFWLPIPYPRTELVDACRADGGFREDAPWEDYGAMDYKNLVYVNPRLGQEKMLDLHRRAYRGYYSSPKVLWRNLRTVRGADDVGRFVKAARAVSGALA